jgi:uncharacterized protein YhbP (UPF0306 family)
MADVDSGLSKLINDYLNAGRVLHIASVSNGKPWLTHVWYAVGPTQYSIIFTSNKTRRHSREIQLNPDVSGGVVAIDLEGLGQKIRGLSFEGKAHEATGDEISLTYDAYARRWPQVRGMFSAKEIETAASNMRMFIINPSRIVLFDEVNFPTDPRQELLVDRS